MHFYLEHNKKIYLTPQNSSEVKELYSLYLHPNTKCTETKLKQNVHIKVLKFIKIASVIEKYFIASSTTIITFISVLQT